MLGPRMIELVQSAHHLRTGRYLAYSNPAALGRGRSLLANGHQNMCDGCPDITVYNGELVWSCRMEEPEKFGDFVQIVPTRDQALV